MNIRAALDALIVIQAGLTITDPASVSVKRAYKYVPDRDSALPDVPCWTNDWTLVRLERRISLMIQFYAIHSQLFVLDADLDRACDIASAFLAEYIDALNADMSLGGAVTTSDLRGGDPTLAALQRGNRWYIGLDLFLDVEMKEAATFA